MTGLNPGKITFSMINRDEHNQIEAAKDGAYTQSDLTFNMLSTKKVYQCDQCLKSFKKNFELTRHIQTHSNVKLFKCDKCDKSFRNATGLNLHQYNKHTIREKNLINIKNKALNQIQQNNPPERNDIESLENPLDSEIDIMTLPLDVSLNQSSFSLDNLNITPMNENENQPMTVTPIYSSNNSEITLDNAPFQLAINNANYLELDNGLMNIGNFLISNDFSTTIENIAKPLDSQIIQTPNQNVSFEPNSIILNQSQLIDGQYYLNKSITMENEQINNIENQLIDPKTSNMEYGIQILDPTMCERKDDSLGDIIQDLPTISLLNTNIIGGDATQLNTLTAKNGLEELNIHNENINILKSTENDVMSFAPENNITIELKPVDPQHNKFLELKKLLKEKKRACAYKYPPLSNCCDQCPASFKKPSDLVRHRRVHTGEKPFICEYCNKAFSLKCTLTTHQILHQKPPELLKVPCKVCGKMIRSGSAMNLHMAIHSGVRPFQCEFCSATFRTSGHRLIHLKVHTKDSVKKSNKKVLSELIHLCENDWDKTKP